MKSSTQAPAGVPTPVQARVQRLAQAPCGPWRPGRKDCSRRRPGGVSLVEVLISLVLGLVLLGAASSAYLANRQTFRQVENLARVNENARTTFELLGRELREAGGTHCGARLPTANVVRTGPTSPWWTDWDQGLRGFDGHEALPARAFGTGTADRVAGTDAVVIWSGSTLPAVAIVPRGQNATQGQPNQQDATLHVHTNDHGLNDGHIVVACDLRQAAIFQVANASPGINSTIVHHASQGQQILPSNCRKELGLWGAAPHDCSNPNGNEPHNFDQGGFLSRLSVSAWYIGHNGRGGTSLYRAVLTTQATGSGASSVRIASTSPEEVIENLSNLQLQYLEPNAAGALPAAYVDAKQVGDWSRVLAVRLAPTYVTAERVGTDGKPIERTLPFLVGIRTRLP